jgi:tetratricopeptide (TPR) repeat protein
VRAIARRELPNLLAAVHAALDAGVPWAMDFADNVIKFLGLFGLSRDRAALAKMVQAGAGKKGSEPWYIARSNLGEQLSAAGSFREAEAVFADILAHLGEAPSHRRCTTLGRLGRCYQGQGQVTRAEAIHRRALADAGQLEPAIGVRRLISTIHTELGGVLILLGRYQDARAEYEGSLTLDTELGDDRGVAVVLGQLGTLALSESKLEEAESRYHQALQTFHRLGEPLSESTVLHQLGRVYQEGNRLQEAEHAYRESARIAEANGDGVAAAQTWGQLANVMYLTGRMDDAEAWYVKALKAVRAGGLRFEEATFLYNLAVVLVNRTGRLGDARACAKQALAIGKTLDPVATEIWNTYRILAVIAGKEGNLEAARGYRRAGRASYAAAPVGLETLRRLGDVVTEVVAAVVDPSQRLTLEEAIAEVREGGRTRLAAALRRILDGERDEDALCEPLDGEDAVIVQGALRGIADPESLKEIPPAEPVGQDAQAADLAQRLEKHLPLIAAVVTAVDQPELRSQLDPVLQQREQHGWNNLVASVRRILDGERSADALVDGLDEEDTLIVGTILTGIENPEALRALLDPSPQPTQPGA